MCIACELGFWDMVDALPAETRERILREEASRQAAPFACDTPGVDAPAPQPTPDARKPIVKNRE